MLEFQIAGCTLLSTRTSSCLKYNLHTVLIPKSHNVNTGLGFGRAGQSTAVLGNLLQKHRRRHCGCR